MTFSKYTFLKLNASNWTELMENLFPIFFPWFWFASTRENELLSWLAWTSLLNLLATINAQFSFILEFCNKVIFVIIAGETGGARNPNLQVVITHASRVCSHRSFGLLPLRIMQFNHTCFHLLPPIAIWSRLFWPSVTWNLRKAQRWSKSIRTPILVAHTP